MTSIIKAEQTARTTERILIKLYENILKEITLDELFPAYPDSIRMKYERLVYDVTRKAIEKVHLEALNYVGSTINIDTYLTTTDIELIKAETQQAVDQFFISLQRGMELQQQRDFEMMINNMNTQLFGAATLLDPVLSIFTSAARNAVSFITGAFAKGVVTKTAQVADITRDMMIAKTGLPSSQQVKYTTAHDERVCARCNSLDGTIYDVDDPGIPQIPDDLHFNCRCFYELVQ